MPEIVQVIAVAGILLFLFYLASVSGIGQAVFSNNYVSGLSTACKAFLVNLDNVNREREQQGLEPLNPK